MTLSSNKTLYLYFSHFYINFFKWITDFCFLKQKIQNIINTSFLNNPRTNILSSNGLTVFKQDNVLWGYLRLLRMHSYTPKHYGFLLLLSADTFSVAQRLPLISRFTFSNED